MNNKQVDILQLQILQGIVERPQHIVKTVQMIPDFGGHEDILSLHTRVLLEKLADALADFSLVLVEPGAVQVAVADAEGIQDGSVGFSLGALAGERAEANRGDLHPVVQCVHWAGGHGC